MTFGRRLTFQLASLLDLLLIVMFSQYLEVQIIVERQAQRLAAQETSTDSELQELQNQLAGARREVEEWERELERSDRATLQQREQLGQMFGEMFRVPESTVRKIIKQRARDPGGVSPADARQLAQELRALAAAGGDQVVDHLLTYVEMKKRFDVWELYLQENGALTVTAGTHQRRVQTGIIRTPRQFSDEFFQVYKSFPQTKSIVLILVSYGDARAMHRAAVTNGLPLVTERMRADSNGTARFEYAVLGYRPEGPEGQ